MWTLHKCDIMFNTVTNPVNAVDRSVHISRSHRLYFLVRQLHLRRFYCVFSIFNIHSRPTTVINLVPFETINVFLLSVCQSSTIAEHETLHFSKLEYWIKYSHYLTIYGWCHVHLMINLRVMCLVFIGFVSVHTHVWVVLADLSNSYFISPTRCNLYIVSK